ncbi:MAG: HPr(Ser) kinase/phosphatase [Mahellales bacterium]|jgi:HPr kinase/phosphorylase
MASILLKEFVEQMNLKVVCSGHHEFFEINTSDINRPGLQMAGFFDYFAYDRLQVMGKVEMTFLEDLDPVIRSDRLEKFFEYDTPCTVVCRDLPIPQEMVGIAQKYDRIILHSKDTTTNFVHKAIGFLDGKLAPVTTQHGVLVDVYGVGMYLIGESGIGKSETALELVKRGHRLVADDAVEIKRVTQNRLVGQAPALIMHLMEIRGVGIIDVKAMYGAGAVINSKSIDLVICLEFWDNNKEYDRLGLVEEYISIMDVKIPRLTIPVRPGRNMAIVLEVAARNFRLKNMGYHAAKELNRRLQETIEGSKE